MARFHDPSIHDVSHVRAVARSFSDGFACLTLFFSGGAGECELEVYSTHTAEARARLHAIAAAINLAAPPVALMAAE